jgi:hypothetical protein
MSKRITLFAVVLCLALIVIIGFVIIQRKSNSLSNPMKAIPEDASLIIQVNNFHGLEEKLISKNQIMTDLAGIQPISQLIENIRQIDSLALKASEFNELFYNSTVYISGHFIGGRKTDFLFIIQQVSNKNIKPYIDRLSEITGQSLKKTERKYEGRSIFSLKTTSEAGEKTYYIAEIEGNLLISKSVILIENAIRQYSLPKSLLSDDDFIKTTSTAGKSKEANLFIHLKEFPRILSVMGNSTFSQKLRDYKHFGGWVELDLNCTEKQIMLNGFISGSSNGESFVELFEGNSPVNITVDKILPASTAYFISLGAEDIQVLHDHFSSYLAKVNTAESRKKKLNALEAKYKIRMEETFLSLMDEEITIAHGTSERGELQPTSPMVLIRCKSGELADRKLLSLFEQIQVKNGRSVEQLKNVYTIDSDTRFEIVEIPVDDLSGLLFGSLFSIKGKSYYTVLGNYIVIGNSREILGDFLYNNVLSKTLSTNEAYKAFKGSIAQKSYFLFYTNLARSSAVFEEYLHPDLVRVWNDNSGIFQKIQPLGMQITEVSGMHYTNILVHYLDEIKDKPQTVWESLLDTTFTFKPQLAENHYTKQNEIFLQDEGNTIYLVNKAGRILWKQKIAEAINSKVFQIDFYNNGKLQFLFSSENYLHMIDRNGNYVERYPVRLRERSTTGMALFDYESNRNYRIFIPCADKKVYAYTEDGSLISGWEFKGSEYTVNQPPEHFRVEDKDFIVFSDKYQVYILDRRGDIRVPVDQIVTRSKNNTFHLDNKKTLDKSRILTTDSTGSIISISFNGDIERISTRKFSPEHFFDFKDINADGEKDFIFLDENRLSAYNQDNSEIFSYSFPNDIKEPAIYFNFSYSDRKLGVTDIQDRKIYLINKDGSLYKGFPLEGSTLFSIGNLESQEGVFNLIVGGRNNFLYNYSVQ